MRAASMLHCALKSSATDIPCRDVVSGYFDVRDFDERWIRIACRKGDMIVLPEGIYHLLTLDSKDYIKVS